MLLIRSMVGLLGHVLAFGIRTRRPGFLVFVVAGSVITIVAGALAAAGVLVVYPFI